MCPLSEAEFEEMFGVKLEPLDSNEPARNEKAPSAVKADGPTRITSPSAARGRRLTSTPATEIRMRSIQWLEQPLWQRSAFQLLAGPKGAGKGTYLAGLAGVRSRDGCRRRDPPRLERRANPWRREDHGHAAGGASGSAAAHGTGGAPHRFYEAHRDRGSCARAGRGSPSSKRGLPA